MDGLTDKYTYRSFTLELKNQFETKLLIQMPAVQLLEISILICNWWTHLYFITFYNGIGVITEN